MNKIILTGASGFLGSILMKNLPGEIITVGRSSSNKISVDLSKHIVELPQADLIIHCAGKAHIVPSNKEQSRDFFKVNVDGTKNLLESISSKGRFPRALVLISTVSVYGLDTGHLIKEDHPLYGGSPYADSKKQAERLVQDWGSKYNVKISILRLPLIAGPNPPGNLKLMINAIKKGFYFNIGNGNARKSIVMAKDVATIMFKAAEVGGVFNLTDGYHPSFAELSNLISSQLHKTKIRRIPYWAAHLAAKAGDLLGPNSPITSDKLKKITKDLTFDDTKARQMIGWNPNPVLESFIINNSV